MNRIYISKLIVAYYITTVDNQSWYLKFKLSCVGYTYMQFTYCTIKESELHTRYKQITNINDCDNSYSDIINLVNNLLNIENYLAIMHNQIAILTPLKSMFFDAILFSSSNTANIIDTDDSSILNKIKQSKLLCDNSVYSNLDSIEKNHVLELLFNPYTKQLAITMLKCKS